MVLLMVGCSPWVTYPPIDGAAHVGQQRLEPVPSIMGEAIRYSNQRFAKMDTIVFNLPEGTPARASDDIARRLGRGARPMRSDDELAIHVTEVRIRAMNAEVDVIYPRADGHHEMVTLFMRQRLLHHYDVRDSRLWRIRVDAPPAHYPAVADPEAENSADAAPDAEARGDE